MKHCQMFFGLRHPALVGGHHQQGHVDGFDAGQHVLHESFVARNVDEGNLDTAGEGRPGESDVDAQAASLLLLPPVGIATGEGLDQGLLSVVDVTGGSYDRHASANADAKYSSRESGTARRSTTRRPSNRRAITGGSADNRARKIGSAEPATTISGEGTSAPGTDPAPTTDAPRTTWASISAPATRRVARASRSSYPAPAILQNGNSAARPSPYISSVISSALRVAASTRSALAIGWRRRRPMRSARPTSNPAWGPPSSLSPENIVRSTPASTAWRIPGSPANQLGGGPDSHGTSASRSPLPASKMTGTWAFSPRATSS